MTYAAVAKVLLVDDNTIRTWRLLYEEDGIEGLACFGYEGGDCRRNNGQQATLITWITKTLPRSTRAIGAWIVAELGIEDHSRSRVYCELAAVRHEALQAEGDIVQARSREGRGIYQVVRRFAEPACQR